MATVLLIAPNNDATSVNYDHKNIFSLRNLLDEKTLSPSSDFLCISSENFLSKNASLNKINPLTDQEFEQVTAELQKCSDDYKNGLFIMNTFIRDYEGRFSGLLSQNVDQWEKLSNGSLYPYATDANLGPDSFKQDKIRNTAKNFSFINHSRIEFEYNMTLSYFYSDSQKHLKTMNLNNYEKSIQDLLNLNLTNTDYKDHVFIENMAPYFGNGYPDPLIDFQSNKFFLFVGKDALNMWDINKITRYNKYDLSDKPLIIQSDSKLSGQKTSPKALFNALFGSITTSDTSEYPATITVNSISASVNQQKQILTFLNKVPYIVFADTEGYIPTSDGVETPGAVYICSPQNTVSGAYTFSRADKLLVAQGTLGEAKYAEYSIPGTTSL